MASSMEELRARMYEAFSKEGFFIFSRGEYGNVSKLLSSLKLHRILRVRVLGRRGPYGVVEIDERVYEMECRNGCMRDHILDERCYLECKQSKRSALLNEVLKELEKNGG